MAAKKKKIKKTRSVTARKKPLPRSVKLLLYIGIPAVLLMILIAVALFNQAEMSKRAENRSTFDQKADLLYSVAMADDVESRIGNGAGSAGQAVFFSVGDMEKRAFVFSGTGSDLESAWRAAKSAAEDGMMSNSLVPKYVKVDIVSESESVTKTSVEADLKSALSYYYRYGLAFDKDFSLALTEAELNSTRIYDYDEFVLSLRHLKIYLKETGRQLINELPEKLIRFQTIGWICDEDGSVSELSDSGYSYGRRIVENADDEYVRSLIKSYSDYLVSETHKNGKFTYSVLPRFDSELDWYNVARHAGTTWSMVQSWRVAPSDELAASIEKAVGYLTKQVVYKGDAAHVYWENRDDFELGADALSLIALTEYMDAFGTDKYLDMCKAIANGILEMQNPDTGAYIHVLNKDFTVKDEFSTVYYEGEASYALLRVYAFTHDKKLLDTAQRQIDRFIEQNYIKNLDHWISYAVNELTKYIDDQKYFDFGLKNIEYCMSYILARKTPSPTRLEQLMCSFEIYLRMKEKGITDREFDIDKLINAVAERLQRSFDGCFYPEISMHMANPQRVTNSFMMRYQGFRVRIDETQHMIGGYYLFLQDYDKLVEYGLKTADKIVDEIQDGNTDVTDDNGDTDDQ